MTRLRTPALVASLLLAALVFSGCIAIKSQTASQRLQGFVTLSVTVCVSNHDAGTTCDPRTRTLPAGTAEGDNGQEGDEQGEGRGQVYIAFRVPNGSSGPGNFQSVDGRMSLAKHAAFTSQLAAQHAPPAGFHWEGYLSTEVAFNPATAADRQTTLAPEFTLPAGADGAPFDGPFRWRAVVGFRVTRIGTLVVLNPNAAVNCTSAGNTCFDSPSTITASHVNSAVSDIGVLAGGTATAGQGETATVSFPIHNRAEGALGARTVALSADTTVPGATAATAVGTLNVPGNGTPTASVSVPIPPNTPVGTYTVTLSASANSGGGTPLARSNQATITVVDKVAPAIRISTPAEGSTILAGQTVTADYGCTDEAGGSGLASCAGTVPAGAAIDTSSPGQKSFTVNATDAAGNAATLTRTYTVAPASTLGATVRGRIVVTIPFDFSANARSTRFLLLQVKGAPSGSTVAVTCKGSGCPKERVRGKSRIVALTKRNAPRTLSLKPWVKKSLRVGTVLTVTVTKPGSFGMVKKITVRANKRPSIATTCLQPNSKTARASCQS